MGLLCLLLITSCLTDTSPLLAPIPAPLPVQEEPAVEYTLRETALSSNSSSFSDASVRALLADDRLPGLTRLELSNTQLSAHGLERLLQDPRMAELKELVLNSSPVGDAGLMIIARSPLASSLDTLNVARIGATPSGVASFADSMPFNDLKLLIGHQNVGDEGAVALAQRPGLRRLDLTTAQVGTTGAVALLTQTTATSISLRDNPVNLDGLSAISPSLRSISFKMVPLTPSDLTTLAAAPAPGLRELNLEQVPIPDEPLAALRNASWLGQLEIISLSAFEAGPQERQAFLDVWGTERWISIYRRDLQ